MTPLHAQLSLYLDRHKYTKGVCKGTAPADPARRGKTHFRVMRRNDGTMVVRFHATDIITCHPDTPDMLTLDTNGGHDRPTTRVAFWGLGSGINGAPLRGAPRLHLYPPRVPKAARPAGSLTEFMGMAWRDGCTVTLDRANNCWEPDGLAPLTKYVADREARLIVRCNPDFKAFQQAFPLLFESMRPAFARSTPSQPPTTVADLADTARWPLFVGYALRQAGGAASTRSAAWGQITYRLTAHLRTEVPA
jgi:hypothetical protein